MKIYGDIKLIHQIQNSWMNIISRIQYLNSVYLRGRERLSNVFRTAYSNSMNRNNQTLQQDPRSHGMIIDINSFVLRKENGRWAGEAGEA